MSPVPRNAVSTRRPLRVPAAAQVSARTALAALVAALVLGIIGMHALANRGTPAAPAGATSATGTSSMAATSSATGATGMAAGTSMTGQEAAHEAALAADASRDAHARRGDSTVAGHGSGHEMASMSMLCVVMIAGAALTVLVLLVVGIWRPVLPAAFAPAGVRVRALQWVRGTGPPPVWQFSVIRC